MDAPTLSDDLGAARARVAALEAAAAAEAEAARIRVAADHAAQDAAAGVVRRKVLRTIHTTNAAMLSAAIEAIDAADRVVDAYQRAGAALKDRPGSAEARKLPAKIPEAAAACRALAARRPVVVKALADERAALAALGRA